MPELPDLTIYIEHLDKLTRGSALTGITLESPFLLRTVTPAPEQLIGRRVVGWRRLSKQLVCELDGSCFLVLHLMISGRLQWHTTSRSPSKRNLLGVFEFSTGSVLFTEASKKKRASLRLVDGDEALAALNLGGLELAGLSAPDFTARLRSSNHTLKRALTDQRVFAGIGNAYSDEILLRARLSPFKRPRDMTDDECAELKMACDSVLADWTSQLRAEAGDTFPRKVTAFHANMAVHGKFREPCPVCGTAVQRIVYAENEANYCPTCQTGGRLLADRALSRLLKADWPKRVEDLG